VTFSPRALLWSRLDTTGSEFVALDDHRGLAARGTAHAATPIPYSCRYELVTDDSWASVRFEATVEGAGWLRTVRMERATGRWRITTAEQGNLDKALRAAGHPPAPFPGSEDPDRLVDAFDVDLYDSPLTNTLPIRRLAMRGAPLGTTHTIVAAWVLLPSLAVLPLEQTYRVLEDDRIRYSSGDFTADLEIDADGYVAQYPELAALAR
jgi:uncharacterized protein